MTDERPGAGAPFIRIDFANGILRCESNITTNTEQIGLLELAKSQIVRSALGGGPGRPSQGAGPIEHLHRAPGLQIRNADRE